MQPLRLTASGGLSINVENGSNGLRTPKEALDFSGFFIDQLPSLADSELSAFDAKQKSAAINGEGKCA